MTSRSYDEYLSNDSKSNTQPTATNQSISSISESAIESTTPSYGTTQTATSYNPPPISSRPNEFEASRTQSFGVTPAILRDQDAHKWSEDVISGINHVEVETPRSELSKSLSDNPSGRTEQVKQTAGNAYNTASETVSNAAQAIKETVAPSNSSSNPTEKVTSTLQSAYNAAANALPTSQPGQPSATQKVTSTLQSAYTAAANALPSTTGLDSSDRSRATVSRLPSEVARSVEDAGTSPEAAANPYAVQRKQQVENELLKEVPEKGSGGTTLETVQNAGSSAYQSAASVASQGVNYMMSALSNATDTSKTNIGNSTRDATSNLPTDHSRDTTGVVPDMVKRSQAEAGYTAPSSGTASHIKQLTEQELLSEVNKDNSIVASFISRDETSTFAAPSDSINARDEFSTAPVRPQATTLDSEQIIKKIPGGW